MSSIDTDLTAIFASRICHDLISPIGAIGNGVELMELSGFESPELALISEAAQNANRRIRFFHLAFGAAPQGQMISAVEIEKILPADIFGSKLPLFWQVEGDLPRTEVKLACLGLMCLETIMPFGGQVSVTRSGECWQVTGISDRIKDMPDLWAMLTVDEVTTLPAPAHLQFVLLGQVLAANGRSVSLVTEDDRVRIGF